MPCPDGWNNLEKSADGNTEKDQPLPEPTAPVTPPSQSTLEATNLAQQFLEQMEAIQRGERPLPLTNVYPTSPGKTGHTGFAPLANLGVASGTGGNTGFAVQYGKPREADPVKLMTFPKPGTSFEKWWDHALDSISAATSFCTEAYRWALQCEQPETTFETLSESGGFIRLDALLLTALMECIPGDTHLLRQEIKKAKTEQRTKHQRNITGRQVLWMVHRFFAMNVKDKEMTDTARLHKVTLQNGDIQQFIYRWDEMLALMTRRPTDDDLMNLFVLQFDVHLAKQHEFYVEYLFWYNRPATDTTRSYEGLWTLVHDWVRRKKETKNRKEALKDHFPGIVRHDATPKGNGKGKGKDKNGNPQVCFAWRNTGTCTRKDAGTCLYAHPEDAKNTGRPKGDSKGGGKKGKSKGKPGGGKGSGSLRGKTITDAAKLCKNYLKGKCTKGDKCTYHHNGPCRFHAKGSCTKGDACIFSHHEAPKPGAVAAAAAPKASAKPGARPSGDNA